MSENIAFTLPDSLANKIIDAIGNNVSKARVKYSKGMSQYHSSIASRFRTFRTIPTGEANLDIIRHTIDTNFRVLIGDKWSSKNEDELLDLIISGTNIVISGTGGSGKTIFVKRSIVKTASKHDIVPIYIELRNINFKEFNMVEAICNELQPHLSFFNTDVCKHALKELNFVIFLDGFDEVPSEFRSITYNKVTKFSEANRQIPIVITSRPDSSDIWTGFNQARVKELNSSEQINLIKKLPYNDGIKQNLINYIKIGVDPKHQSFMIIPLLLTIVLLTYGRDGKLHNVKAEFYAQAFEALIFRHDYLSKGDFKRRKSLEITESEFEKVFSTFCFLTYIKEKYTFTKREITDVLAQSININNQHIEPEKLLKDLVEAVCLIVRDSGHYSFSHRSFQEYFAALYAVSNPRVNLNRFANELVENRNRDITAKVMHELNAEMVQDKILNPLVQSLKITDKMIFEDIEDNFIAYGMTSNGHSIFYNEKIHKFCRYASQFYDGYHYLYDAWDNELEAFWGEPEPSAYLQFTQDHEIMPLDEVKLLLNDEKTHHSWSRRFGEMEIIQEENLDKYTMMGATKARASEFYTLSSPEEPEDYFILISITKFNNKIPLSSDDSFYAYFDCLKRSCRILWNKFTMAQNSLDATNSIDEYFN